MLPCRSGAAPTYTGGHDQICFRRSLGCSVEEGEHGERQGNRPGPQHIQQAKAGDGVHRTQLDNHLSQDRLPRALLGCSRAQGSKISFGP